MSAPRLTALRVSTLALSSVFLTGIATDGVDAQTLRLQEVASGLTQPLFVGAPRGDSRLFIVEKTGQIKILQNGSVLPTPFLNVSSIINTSSERGLLGLAFDPNFATNGHVYVNLTGNNTGSTAGYAVGTSFVRRYTVSATNPNVIDTSTVRDVIIYNQDFSNHNGGWLDFSPNDGLLYIPTGDGGSGNDPNNRAQTWNTELGKMLRIDPNGDDYPGDVRRNYRVPASNPWATDTNPVRQASIAYGLRNPWRSSFDPNTGDLYIADVGQGAREEINLHPATSTGGENYGWRLREGKIATPTSGVGGNRPADNIDPFYDYPRSVGGSITGGVVYRGEFLEPLIGGQYFFADYNTNILRSLDVSQLSAIQRDPVTGKLVGTAANGDLSSFNPTIINRDSLRPTSPVNITGFSSFGVDGSGEMYIVSLNNGRVFRFTADRLPGDANFDNRVDLNDFFILQANWGLSNRSINQGDANGDRFIGIPDLNVLINNFAQTPLGIDPSIPGFEIVQAWAASVPEPATLAVLAAPMLLLSRRRR